MSLQCLSKLPVISLTFRLNAYSIIKVFYFSNTIVENISGLGGNFTFNYIFPTGTTTGI